MEMEKEEIEEEEREATWNGNLSERKRTILNKRKEKNKTIVDAKGKLLY